LCCIPRGCLASTDRLELFSFFFPFFSFHYKLSKLLQPLGCMVVFFFKIACRGAVRLRTCGRKHVHATGGIGPLPSSHSCHRFCFGTKQRSREEVPKSLPLWVLPSCRGAFPEKNVFRGHRLRDGKSLYSYHHQTRSLFGMGRGGPGWEREFRSSRGWPGGCVLRGPAAICFLFSGISGMD